MQNVAKNLVIETDIFNNNDSNADNIEKDLKEENRKNLELSMANPYSHAVVCARKKKMQ